MKRMALLGSGRAPPTRADAASPLRHGNGLPHTAHAMEVSELDDEPDERSRVADELRHVIERARPLEGIGRLADALRERGRVLRLTARTGHR